jgi:DNA excision repair protein ERCC-4
MPSVSVIMDPGVRHSGVVKALEKQSVEIEIKPLEAGDFVINGGITFERLTLEDILKSIFEDRKLLSRIRDVANRCERPVLVIEGEDPFFSGRTINPASIQGLLSKIVILLRIPVIYTLNEAETAKVISSMARAEQPDKV